jgi:hypothetical protein
MTFNCLNDTYKVPSKCGCHVHVRSKNQRSSYCRQKVSEEVLKGMGVLRSNSNCNDVGVVNLVNVLIQERCVQHSVRHGEKEVLTHHTKHEGECECAGAG